MVPANLGCKLRRGAPPADCDFRRASVLSKGLPSTTCGRKGTENDVHFLKEKTKAERGVATARSEAVAEPALEPRSLNSQPGLFLTPEPQWNAGVLWSPRPASCHPAPDPPLPRLLGDGVRDSQKRPLSPVTAALQPTTGAAPSPYRLIALPVARAPARGRLGNEVQSRGVAG